MSNKLKLPFQRDMTELFANTSVIIVNKDVLGEEKDIITPDGFKLRGRRAMPIEISRIESENEIKEISSFFVIKLSDMIESIFSSGEYSFDFFDDRQHRIAQIRYIGFDYIRWNEKWRGDAELEMPELFMKWLKSQDENLKSN